MSRRGHDGPLDRAERGSNAAPSSGSTFERQHLRAAAPLGYGRDPDSAEGNEDGLKGDCARQTARGDGENSAQEIAHGAVGMRRSGRREGSLDGSLMFR